MNKYFELFLKKVVYGSLKYAKKQGLKAGNNVNVMSQVNFGSEPYLIEIGNNVLISSNVSFITHDGGTWVFTDKEEYKEVIKYGKIIIGNNVFIGAKSIIMPGVRIGNRCVVGAGSIVTKSVPGNCVVAGVPAKIIMKTDEYADKSKRNMKPYDVAEYKKNKQHYLVSYVDDPE